MNPLRPKQPLCKMRNYSAGIFWVIVGLNGHFRTPRDGYGGTGFIPCAWSWRVSEMTKRVVGEYNSPRRHGGHGDYRENKEKKLNRKGRKGDAKIAKENKRLFAAFALLLCVFAVIKFLSLLHLLRVPRCLRGKPFFAIPFLVRTGKDGLFGAAGVGTTLCDWLSRRTGKIFSKPRRGQQS